MIINLVAGGALAIVAVSALPIAVFVIIAAVIFQRSSLNAIWQKLRNQE